MPANKVLLVHGLGNGIWFMKKIGTGLQKVGFRPVYFGYPMRNATFFDHLNLLRQFVDNAKLDSNYMLVAHSYGALLCCAAIKRGILPYPARSVFLSPLVVPRSTLARRWYALLSHVRYGDWIMEFAVGDVITRLGADTLADLVGEVEFPRPLGIIHAKLPQWLKINPLLGNEPNDGTLLLKESQIDNADEVVYMARDHTTMLLSRRTRKLVVSFLKYGSFSVSHQEEQVKAADSRMLRTKAVAG